MTDQRKAQESIMIKTANKTVREGHTSFGRKKSKRFLIGFSIYMLLLFSLILVGLALLWRVMDAFERSRPNHRMEAYLAETDSDYWRNILLDKGVGRNFVGTLDLEDASFYKKMDMYTDAVPTYGIRFGKEEMLTVSLEKGEDLSYGYHLWEIGSVDLIGRELYIFAPPDAVISRDGKEIGKNCLVQENAQELELGVFDRNREDIAGLSKYQLDYTYDLEGIVVEDNAGNVLELSYLSGNAYYFAPFMDDYKITVPAGSLVRVNGIVLNGENAKIESSADEDFEGIEEFLPLVPAQDVYTIEGLIMPPDIEVETAYGNRLISDVEDRNYLYEIDDEIPEELAQYVMKVFDAYIAFSGNRDGNFTANYNRYKACLVPGSEAADRAYMSRASLKWVSGRDAWLKSAVIKKYIAYSEELFTCQINFSLINEESENANAYLFVFVWYNGEWRVVRVLNKTSYLIQDNE